MMTFNDIVKHVKSLPPLSNITFKIQQLYNEGAENANVIELIRLIESDVALTANVLKFVNAPKYGFSKKISSVSQAVTLLGMEIIYYGIIVDYAMHEKLKADISSYGITNLLFNDIRHLQSFLVMQWYSIIDLRDAQFLTLLALIMEIGKLIIAKKVVESDYTVKFCRGLSNVESVTEYEYEIFDTTSYYVSALLYEHWNLDETFVEILKNLDFVDENTEDKIEHYTNILDIVRTAINVHSILTDKSITEAAKKVEAAGLSEETFKHIAKRMKKTYEGSKGIA